MPSAAEQPDAYKDWTAYQQAHRALQRGRKTQGKPSPKTPRLEVENYVSKHQAIALDDPHAEPELVELRKLRFCRGPAILYIVVGGVQQHRLSDDDAALLGALRAQAKNPIDFGAVETWAVDGFLSGQRVRRLYRGTIAALRLLWPDRHTRRALKKAGCVDLHLLGNPVQIDKRAAR